MVQTLQANQAILRHLSLYELWHRSFAIILLFVAVKAQLQHSTPRIENHQYQSRIYIGLLLNAETRKRGLVEKLHHLGLSTSYDRVLQISTDIGNSVCEQFEKNQLVCPRRLCQRLSVSLHSCMTERAPAQLSKKLTKTC